MSYLDLCDSQWNGKVLFISIDPEYSDLEDVYKNAISNHNKNIKKTFYLYPRSSISKTRVRLANNVGIIDSGYRGNICAYFDIKKTLINENLTSEKDNAVIILSKYQRVLQICSNNLEPFKVILINNIESLGETERGDGGFGSTGV